MSSKKKTITIAITTVALFVSSIGASQASQNSGAAKSAVSSAKDHHKILVSVLATLVTKATITQSQSDSIIAGVLKNAKALKNDGNYAAREALTALTLGIDVRTLHERSKAGESLATMAGTKKDALIAVLVLDQTKRIDAFVAAGKITAAQATILKAGLVDRVVAKVNAVGKKKGGHYKGDKIGHKD